MKKNNKDLSNVVFSHNGIHTSVGAPKRADEIPRVSFHFTPRVYVIGVHWIKASKLIFIYYLPMCCVRIRYGKFKK